MKVIYCSSNIFSSFLAYPFSDFHSLEATITQCNIALIYLGVKEIDSLYSSTPNRVDYDEDHIPEQYIYH